MTAALVVLGAAAGITATATILGIAMFEAIKYWIER